MTTTKRLPRHRLDPEVRPSRVAVHVDVDPERSASFRGEVSIHLEVGAPRRRLRLHAVDLRVAKPRLEVGGVTLSGRAVPLPELEMVELVFDQRIPAGEMTLTLDFAGKLRSDLCGLYRARADGHRYAFTQLEATDARKFFPCFDEPAMKARFRMSVTTAASHTVISNAPEVKALKGARGPGAGRKTVHFAETPPLSTYLVALAVGRLESSRPTHLGPTEIRVWHTPGKGRLTGFGLEAARECLRGLERYFALPYPYTKLDLVAVPDFEFGAMENAGAVFFRETLLLVDRATATLAEKKRAAEVICHELAHMWYGDLVTMAWWDDLWLNEAFATWMAFHVVDGWKPEWKMWQDFMHGRAAALELDALRHTHPIYCRVDTAEQANENFDVITYEKGASVVRMIERYLGASAFRKGVRAYIREHREGNAVADDLWRALSKASGEDVERVARGWIEQEGYPVLKVRHERKRGRSALILGQERFVLKPFGPTERSEPKRPRWPVPVVTRIGRGRRSRTTRHLSLGARDRVSLGRDAPSFIYANAEESGFYRPLHSPAELRNLLSHLPSLTAIERMGLIDHQWALARAGRAPLSSVLEISGALAGDPEADVLAALRKPLAFVSGSLIPEAAPKCEDAFRDWLLEHFAASFEELGWKPEPREDDATRVRRAMLLGIVGGMAGSPKVIDEARAQCDRYLANRRSVDANLADGIVSLAARSGDKKLHTGFVRAMESAATPQEKRRFLLALADFESPALIDKTLGFTLTDRIPTQDVIFVLARLLSNRASKQRTWSFVRKRWSKLRGRMPAMLASRLIEATPALLTSRHRREVSAFFRSHPIPGGERALRQALERFDWYRSFRSGAAESLRKTLSRQRRAGSPGVRRAKPA